jgi:hypothetical protein
MARPPKSLIFVEGMSTRIVEWRKSRKASRHLEPVLKPSQVAKVWGVSPDFVRRIFLSEPGVLRDEHAGGRRRRYTVTLIPHTVFERVCERMGRPKTKSTAKSVYKPRTNIR